MEATRICSTEGCQGAPIARGMCGKHYQRWRKNADPREVRLRAYPTLAAAMIGRTKPGPNGCVLWTAKRKGYAPHLYGALSFGGRSYSAHRAAYELANGPIPAGMDIDHVCHRTLCVNPAHLRLATRKQNSENLTGAHSNSLTGVRGVTYDKVRGQYRARIKHERREIHIGRFDTLKDAEQAVSAARRRIFTHSDMDS